MLHKIHGRIIRLPRCPRPFRLLRKPPTKPFTDPKNDVRSQLNGGYLSLLLAIRRQITARTASDQADDRDWTSTAPAEDMPPLAVLSGDLPSQTQPVSHSNMISSNELHQLLHAERAVLIGAWNVAQLGLGGAVVCFGMFYVFYVNLNKLFFVQPWATWVPVCG